VSDKEADFVGFLMGCVLALLGIIATKVAWPIVTMTAKAVWTKVAWPIVTMTAKAVWIATKFVAKKAIAKAKAKAKAPKLVLVKSPAVTPECFRGMNNLAPAKEFKFGNRN